MKRLFLLLLLIVQSFSTNAQTKAEVERELHHIGVPHSNIVLAQARLETGNFTSRRCREDHNLFGMKRRGKYAKYRRWQDSIADYKMRISSRYNGGDYYTFLKRIGYAKDQNYIKKLKKF